MAGTISDEKSSHSSAQGDGSTTSVSLTISPVVPAYNASGTLRRCLAALFEAGFSPDSIILVDDASTDGTGDVAREMGVEPIVLEKNGGAAVARNTGARESDADILFFVDADVVLHTGAKEKIAKFFRGYPDYAAVFGAYDNAPPEGGIVSRFRNLLHTHVHEQNAGDASTFWTGCGAVRKTAFETAGGFNPAQKWVMIEDVVLGVAIARNGGRIRLEPEIRCTHLKAWTLASMCKTDMFHRAMPWARLLKTDAGKASAKTLNVSRAGQLSGLTVGMSLLSLPLLALSAPAGGALLIASIGALAWANRRFLSKINQVRGFGEAFAAVPLLWLHYLSAVLGYALVKLRLA